MKTISMIAAGIVTLALIAYSIGILTEQRQKKVVSTVLIFLTLGLCLDISGTILMIMGSSGSIFSLHGMLGYSSLTLMIIETILVWRLRNKNGLGTVVPKGIHIYSRIAYIWWVAAYITGGMLVAMR